MPSPVVSHHHHHHHQWLMIGIAVIIILQIIVIIRTSKEKYEATSSKSMQMTPLTDYVVLPPDQYILPNNSGIHTAFVLSYIQEKGIKNFNPHGRHIQNHNDVKIDMTKYKYKKGYRYFQEWEPETSVFHGPWIKKVFLYSVHNKIKYIQNAAPVDIFLFVSILDKNSKFLFVPIQHNGKDVWKIDWDSVTIPEGTRLQKAYITILIRGVGHNFDGVLPPFYLSEHPHPVWEKETLL
jgi:hypothetical protein